MIYSTLNRTTPHARKNNPLIQIANLLFAILFIFYSI